MKPRRKSKEIIPKSPEQLFGDIDERIASPALLAVDPVIETPASPDPECTIPLEDLESASIEQLTHYLDNIRNQLMTLKNEEEPVVAKSPKVIPLDTESDGSSSKRASCDERPEEVSPKGYKIPEVITLSDDDDDETLGHLRQLALLSHKTKEIESAMTKVEDVSEIKLPKEEDVDEDELRAQLLRSLLIKANPVTEIEPSPKIEKPKSQSSLLLPSTSTEIRNKSPTSVKPIKQKVDSVVIKFDDEDEDDEEQKNDFTMKMDSLLSSARRASSSPAKSIPLPLKGSALNKLSEASQKEYLWLKKQIKDREIKAAGVVGQLKHNQEKMVELKVSMDSKKKNIPVLKSKLSDKKQQVQKAQKHANKMSELFRAAQKILKQKIGEMDRVTENLKEIQNTLRTEQQEFRVIDQECASLKVQLEGSPMKRTSAVAKLSEPSSLSIKKAKTNPPLITKTIVIKTDEQPSATKVAEVSQVLMEGLTVTKSPDKRSVSINSPVRKDFPIQNQALSEVRSENQSNVPSNQKSRTKNRSKNIRGSTSKKSKLNSHDCVKFYESIRNLMLTNNSEVDVDLMAEDKGSNEVTVSRGTVSRESLLETKKTFSYESVLNHLHSYRFSKNFPKSTDQSFLGPVMCNTVDPNAIICNVELVDGVCTDPDCDMQHKSKYLITDPVTKLMDILLYDPSLAGASPTKIKTGSEDTLEKLKTYVTNFVDEMKSKGIMDHENIAMELTKQIRLKNKGDNFTSLKRKVKKANRSRVVLTFGNFQYDFSIGTCGPIMNFSKIEKENHNPFEGEEKVPKVRFFQQDESPDLPPDISRLRPEEIASLSLEALAKCPKNSKIACRKALQILARGLDLYPKSPLLWREYLSLFQTFQVFKM